MRAEGVDFQVSTNVGEDFPASDLLDRFDAACLTGGSTVPRTLGVEGEDLDGVHVAMDYLTQQNRVNRGQADAIGERIDAAGKTVVILGGGDTGADCLGTAHRQGAEVVYQYELLSEPPKERPTTNPWPYWPLILRTSSAHEEGGIRDYSILTKSFSGTKGKLETIHAVRIEWEPDESGRMKLKELPGTEFDMQVDLVFLALGFLHPQREGMLEQLGLELDPRGNVRADDNKMTSVPGVFTAGDMTRGQSLVVWAIAEGRQAAHCIDHYLMGSSNLPSVNLKAFA
jgi:glutamate synthase (NADPH/NADH) small chain